MQRSGPGGSASSELTGALRWASLLYALAVTVVTLLPSDQARGLGLVAANTRADDALGALLAYLAAAVAAALLIVIPWRMRLARRLGVSWPLLLCAVGYVAGVALLASASLRASLYELVVYEVPDGVQGAFGPLDPAHAAGYAGFGLLAGLAWRERLHPVPTGGIVLAFSWLLEELQRFAPGREPSMVDLTSNATGILVGYVGIGLLAALSAAPRSHRRSRSSRHRRHRSRHGSGRGRRYARDAHAASRSSRRSARGPGAGRG